MNYIRQVHVEYPGTSNQHITQVHSSSTINGPLYSQSKQAVIAAIDRGENYRSHNDNTGDEAPVLVRRPGGNAAPYIATVADGRETNNLLSLPRF